MIVIIIVIAFDHECWSWDVVCNTIIYWTRTNWKVYGYYNFFTPTFHPFIPNLNFSNQFFRIYIHDLLYIVSLQQKWGIWTWYIMTRMNIPMIAMVDIHHMFKMCKSHGFVRSCIIRTYSMCKIGRESMLKSSGSNLSTAFKWFGNSWTILVLPLTTFIIRGRNFVASVKKTIL